MNHRYSILEIETNRDHGLQWTLRQRRGDGGLLLFQRWMTPVGIERAVLLIFLLSPANAMPEVLRVPSPHHASIQDAIDAAADGDTVLVAEGTYLLDTPLDFNRFRDPEADPDEPPPPFKELVVRSESGPESTFLRLIAPQPERQQAVVIFRNGESRRSVLDGFTLIRDVVTARGILCKDSSPEVRNCIVVGGRVSFGVGGGLLCENSAAFFSDCVFAESIAYTGGGVWMLVSDVTMIRCAIVRNNAFLVSVRVDIAGGSARFYDCTISENLGMGLSISGAEVTLSGCTIMGNRNTGVKCNLDSRLRIENCVIAGNSGEFSAGISSEGSDLSIVNSSVVQNRREDGRLPAGIITSASSGRVSITNSIVWGNRGGSLRLRQFGPLRITHSCIEGEEVWSGEGNLNQAPGFVREPSWDDPGTLDDLSDDLFDPGDMRLLASSPCVDAGAAMGVPERDLAGNPRLCWNGVDMGAFEYCGGALPAATDRFFKRGDSDGNSAVEITDAIRLLGYLFLGETEPPCLDAADADDSGKLDVTDAIAILVFLFGDAGNLPPPGAATCGRDESFADNLGCAGALACEPRDGDR